MEILIHADCGYANSKLNRPSFPWVLVPIPSLVCSKLPSPMAVRSQPFPLATARFSRYSRFGTRSTASVLHPRRVTGGLVQARILSSCQIEPVFPVQSCTSRVITTSSCSCILQSLQSPSDKSPTPPLCLFSCPLLTIVMSFYMPITTDKLLLPS